MTVGLTTLRFVLMSISLALNIDGAWSGLDGEQRVGVIVLTPRGEVL